jgi:ribosome-binding protein aMBF1 (putative translation factor)
MPVCKECGDEVETLVTIRVGRKRVKLCEDCADRRREADEIAEESVGVVRNMMGYTGQR